MDNFRVQLIPDNNGYPHVMVKASYHFVRDGALIFLRRGGGSPEEVASFAPGQWCYTIKTEYV